MRLILLIALLLPGLLSNGQKKKVCFTFDDMPVVAYSRADTAFQKKLVDRLILSLNKNSIPAIGFVNEGKLYDSHGKVQFQVDLLIRWAASGLDLGNHTYSHPDYNSTSFKQYTGNILKGEIVTKEILRESGRQLKYFRHPFLHVGNTKEKADSLSSFLAGHGYAEAPVTIDNEEYLFAFAYNKAAVRSDTNLMTTIGRDYIGYMEKKLEYYEMQSEALFGREINHILLLHSNLLNSDYLDSLACMYKKNGYEFAGMDEVLEDEVYKTEITVFGSWGISWIDRWALSAGKKGSFFADEPQTPDYIRKMAE